MGISTVFMLFLATFFVLTTCHLLGGRNSSCYEGLGLGVERKRGGEWSHPSIYLHTYLPTYLNERGVCLPTYVSYLVLRCLSGFLNV